MRSTNPSELVGAIQMLVGNVLSQVSECEWETLADHTLLAERIGQVVCQAIPHKSVASDILIAKLIFASAEFCGHQAAIGLDTGMVIAGRRLLLRCVEFGSDGTIDALARLDACIALVEYECLTDPNDIKAVLSKVRRCLSRATQHDVAAPLPLHVCLSG